MAMGRMKEGNIYRERREMLYHYSFTRMVSFHGEGRERDRKEGKGRDGKLFSCTHIHKFSVLVLQL